MGEPRSFPSGIGLYLGVGKRDAKSKYVMSKLKIAVWSCAAGRNPILRRNTKQKKDGWQVSQV